MPSTNTIYHGEIAGSTDAAQMPSVNYKWGYIAALEDNAGNVYIGSSSDVARKSDSTTDGTGLQLDAGQFIVLDFLPPDLQLNLNEHWYICDNSGDGLTYYLRNWTST